MKKWQVYDRTNFRNEIYSKGKAKRQNCERNYSRGVFQKVRESGWERDKERGSKRGGEREREMVEILGVWYSENEFDGIESIANIV